MHKILTVIGARPQFIKAAAISTDVKNRNDILEVIVHTGQHYDDVMSKIFFEELGIPKEKYNLEVGSGSQTQMTAEIMSKLEPILIKENPDCVLLYGDTNSTLASALVASKLHIPIAHVEAGIRSKRKNRPEEVNRIITDHLSALLFPPTKEGEDNLKQEGLIYNHLERVSNNNPLIKNCGDVMYDNFLRLLPIVDKLKEASLSKFVLQENNYIILTVHRALNTDNPEKLKNILAGINQLSIDENIKIIFPIHPRTFKEIQSTEFIAINKQISLNKNFVFCQPLSFIEMMVLQKYCKLIITDSGGVQKEAAFFEKPCIVLLESTPWKELVQAGVLIEVGDNAAKIKAAYTLLSRKTDLQFPKIFGSGNASSLILDEIINFVDSFTLYKDEIKFQ